MKVSRGGRSCPEKAPPAQVTALHATASVRRQFLRSVAGTRPRGWDASPQAGTRPPGWDPGQGRRNPSL